MENNGKFDGEKPFDDFIEDLEKDFQKKEGLEGMENLADAHFAYYKKLRKNGIDRFGALSMTTAFIRGMFMAGGESE